MNFGSMSSNYEIYGLLSIVSFYPVFDTVINDWYPLNCLKNSSTD
jgi:hypothetical protein